MARTKKSQAPRLSGLVASAAKQKKKSKSSGKTRAEIQLAAADKKETIDALKAENAANKAKREEFIKTKYRKGFNKLKDDDEKAQQILHFINTLVARDEAYRSGELPSTSNCKNDLGLPKSNISNKKAKFDLSNENHFKCAFAKWRFDHGFPPSDYPIPGYDKKRQKRT